MMIKRSSAASALSVAIAFGLSVQGTSAHASGSLWGNRFPEVLNLHYPPEELYGPEFVEKFKILQRPLDPDHTLRHLMVARAVGGDEKRPYLAEIIAERVPGVGVKRASFVSLYPSGGNYREVVANFPLRTDDSAKISGSLNNQGDLVVTSRAPNQTITDEAVIDLHYGINDQGKPLTVDSRRHTKDVSWHMFNGQVEFRSSVAGGELVSARVIVGSRVIRKYQISMYSFKERADQVIDSHFDSSNGKDFTLKAVMQSGRVLEVNFRGEDLDYARDDVGPTDSYQNISEAPVELHQSDSSRGRVAASYRVEKLIEFKPTAPMGRRPPAVTQEPSSGGAAGGAASGPPAAINK